MMDSGVAHCTDYTNYGSRSNSFDSDRNSENVSSRGFKVSKLKCAIMQSCNDQYSCPKLIYINMYVYMKMKYSD